jgi:hypothetical protein
LSGAEVKVDEDELDAYRTSFSVGLRDCDSIEPPLSIDPPLGRESNDDLDMSDSDMDMRRLGLFELKGKQSGGGGGGGGGDMVVGSQNRGAATATSD